MWEGGERGGGGGVVGEKGEGKIVGNLPWFVKISHLLNAD